MRSVHCLLVLFCLSLTGCFGEPTDTTLDQEHQAQAGAPAVELAGWVTDAADLLNDTQEKKLAAKLAALKVDTQHQMVIVTVPSLEGRDIKPFTTDLGNAWGIGRKGIHDGIIILVAPNERQARIAVGFGLEDTLSDNFCASVLQIEMLPLFRQGDYYTGLDRGVTALADAVR